MIVLAEIRYTQPLETVVAHTEAHRAYLRELHARGRLVLSGPLEPRTGGVLILCVEDLAEAATMAARDPFTLAGVADYSFREWRPVVGAELAAAWEETRRAHTP